MKLIPQANEINARATVALPGRLCRLCAIVLAVSIAGSISGAHAQPPPAAQKGWKPVVKVADHLLKAPKRYRKRRQIDKKTALSRAPVSAKPRAVPPVVKIPKRRPAKKIAMVQHSDVTRKYCENISDAAADARLAWQTGELNKLRDDLDLRLRKLASRTSELKIWLKRRKAFIRTSQKGLVKIYSGMRPDVAALQLVAMDEMTASSLLARFKPRVASTILNEMKPKNAARLASIIAGAAKVQPAETGSDKRAGGSK